MSTPAAPAPAAASPAPFLSTTTPAAATPAPAEPTPAAPANVPPATPAPATPAVTPAPTSKQFFAEGISKNGQFAEGWTQQLQDLGFERLANKAALAKDEPTLFKSLDDALGLIGKKAGVSYPKEGADEAAIMAFRADAGVPESPAGYDIKPTELPEGITWDDATAAAYAEAMHKHHIPAAAAKELVNAHLAQLQTQMQAAQQEYVQQLTQKVETCEKTFREEWGRDYDTRLESNRAYIQSRFTPEELADLSNPAVVRIIDEARIGLREAPLPGVGREITTGTHSPRQQALELMKANPRWERDPDLVKRINSLHALENAQQKRKK
jgi:hypothetical protein